MSVEIEDRVRAALQEKAVEVDVRGIDHQSAFNNDAILMLTQHLIVKLVQKLQ